MKPRLRTRVGKVMLLCILTGILTFNSGASTTASDEGVEFIKIGRGNATLVKSTSGSTTIYGLVDAGTSSQYTSYVNPYLTAALGSAKLTFIAVTHGDSDHAGGIVLAINDFANSNTKLFLKDVAGNTSGKEKDVYQINLAMKNAAKAKHMPIVKIRPYSSISASSVNSISDIRNLSDSKFMAKYEIFTRNSSGSYVSDGTLYNTYTFGRFTITFYNGNNWNKTNFISSHNGGWDENVNATPIKLRCTTSTGKIYTTYLGSDLGENSYQGYSYEIADRVADIVGHVSIYQVAHHGFYNSIKPDTTAAHLNPKYAIVTTSYNNLVNTYYENKGITDPDSSDLSAATSTIKRVCKATDLIKVYFTNGKGNPPDNRIINVLAENNYALLNWTGTTIKSGSVKFSFTGNSMSVVQG